MSKVNKDEIKIELYPQISNIYPSKKKKKYKKEGFNQEKYFKNKFDSQYNRFNEYDSRKYSKDSSTLSTSNEDIIEKDLYEKTPSPNRHNNNSNIYKGNASDFKIKYKTELCKYYEIEGHCKYGNNCAYAHGIDNLRSKVTNSMFCGTRKCIQFFETGYCPYGSRCQFQHQSIKNKYYKQSI